MMATTISEMVPSIYSQENGKLKMMELVTNMPFAKAVVPMKSLIFSSYRVTY